MHEGPGLRLGLAEAERSPSDNLDRDRNHYGQNGEGDDRLDEGEAILPASHGNPAVHQSTASRSTRPVSQSIAIVRAMPGVRMRIVPPVALPSGKNRNDGVAAVTSSSRALS